MYQQLSGRPLAPVRLSEEALRALRAALSGLKHTGVEAPELRTAICGAAREARLHNVPPERLLVWVKTVWHDAESGNPAADPREQTRIFDEMVSVCIQEYFRGVEESRSP